MLNQNLEIMNNMYVQDQKFKKKVLPEHIIEIMTRPIKTYQGTSIEIFGKMQNRINAQTQNGCVTNNS